MFSRIAALRLPFELPFAHVPGGRYYCHATPWRETRRTTCLQISSEFLTYEEFWSTIVTKGPSLCHVEWIDIIYGCLACYVRF